MAEVEACLAPHDYTTIHAEDLSPADQMRLFREAEAMVAVHGAALAPLLYVPPGGRLRQLVEILPVGHMTDVYRVMAEQVGVGWTGVRGRIKPKHVEPAYRIGTPFKRFSLDSFEVDIVALERALDFAAAASVDSRAGAAPA
jgi:capsular polysaccharide biosynthesis protein